MDSQLDPLSNPDVQRVLLLGRARERYPTLSRRELRACCESAWATARAGGGRGGLPQRFKRALALVVWARQGGRARMPLAELVEQTIPRLALDRFRSPAAAPAPPPAAVNAQPPARLATPIPASATGPSIPAPIQVRRRRAPSGLRVRAPIQTG